MNPSIRMRHRLCSNDGNKDLDFLWYICDNWQQPKTHYHMEQYENSGKGWGANDMHIHNIYI